MDIEILENIVLTSSILDRVDKKINTPVDWLSGFETFSARYVGGLHNLSPSDKMAWAKNSNNPLRIIETTTGREEVWFPNKNNKPSYISLNKSGEVESHRKFNKFMPAIHFSSENLPTIGSMLFHPKKLDLWYHNDVITGVGENSGVSATGIPCTIKDKKVEYIESILFDNLFETWEDGEWKSSQVSNMKIMFTNPEKNSDETSKEVVLWLKEHCKEGFFPFSDKLFGSEEEEFLFVSDFCT